MATGTVQWFNDAKGYGSILPDDDAEQLFVHPTRIVGDGYKSLPEGARLRFDAVPGMVLGGPIAKGLEATNVRIV